MIDENDVIIYIGKAKRLDKRVSQYFLRPQSGKVATMVSNVSRFETIITANEKEALILESNLIKEHLPRFNVLLKDDSHYPYIALRKSGNDPYLRIARKVSDPKNYAYFGPYPNSSSAYRIIDLLNKIFPLRKCKNIPSTPCLYYHLNQCLAPCINEIEPSVYQNLIKQIESFLNGNDSEIKAEIRTKMYAASESLNFESAHEYKLQLEAIEQIMAKQTVDLKEKIDRDIFAYSVRDNYFALAVLVYRSGLLLGKELYVVEQFGSESDQFANLITQYYGSHPLPDEIIIGSEKIANELRPFLETSIIAPKQGDKVVMVLNAQENAAQGLDEHFLTARLSDDNLALLNELGELLHINTPYRIDIFDIAHLQGEAPLGAAVVYINGEPVKRMYRRYNISKQNAGNDIGSLDEVLTRRYKRIKEENQPLPDLIIVDGGIAHVNAALNALNNLDLDVTVAGLVKDEKHQTKALLSPHGEVVELDTRSPLFFFLMRMQDEVHRYVITFHRRKRRKKAFKSILDDIKGLGRKRQQIIRSAYPTLQALQKASVEELSQLIPENVAKALYEKVQSVTPKDTKELNAY